MKRDKLVILLILLITTLLIHYCFFNNSVFDIPIKDSRNKYELNYNLVNDFILNSMSDSEGGIYTNYLDSNMLVNKSTGHEILSESLGLAMLNTVYQRNQVEFNRYLTYLNENFLLPNGLIPWRIKRGFYKATTSAAVDDLRILRALIYANELWPSTKIKGNIKTISSFLLNNYTEQSFLLNVEKSEDMKNVITLSYLDIYTMKLLCNYNFKWNSIYKKSKSLLIKGLAVSNVPLFNITYSAFNNTFVENTKFNMIDSLMCLLHLVEAGESSNEMVRWLKQEFYNNNVLLSHYEINDGVIKETGYESTAVYAIAMRIALELNDDEFYHALVGRMIKFQDTNLSSKVYGAFADSDKLEAYSFDNLQALIALGGWGRE